MIVIMVPMAWLLQPGPILGHGAFFASGLPGGLDYVMLIMVKQGWMSSLTEKRINSNIMVPHHPRFPPVGHALMTGWSGSTEHKCRQP
jgi:hypothetical protein